MVYLANLEAEGLVFTYALFGVQHDELTPDKKTTISKLYELLSQSADRVDHLQDESHGAARTGPKSTTFVAYWLKSADYEAWKETDAVKDFWNNLPDDAGVWREVMTVPKSRYMFAASQKEVSGLATVLGLKESSDEGYWGVYRHRLSETPDKHTDPSDTFTSPLVSKGKAKGDTTKRVVDLSRSPVHENIRRGRVKLTKVPDNLCYCREGQSQPNLDKDELDTWKEKLAPYAKSWMDHLDSDRDKNGVVSFTFHIGHEIPRSTFDAGVDLEKETGSGAEAGTETKPIAEANQLMYFLDLAHFELAGRSWRDHVKLRQTTMEMYGPGGQHNPHGKLSLFVELCVLKSGDLDAEYVGCKEGTGLMFLEDL